MKLYILLFSSIALAQSPVNTPCRQVDTRVSHNSIASNKSQVFNLSGAPCNYPAAFAYLVNITVIPKNNNNGYALIWPNGQPMPLASTVNFDSGKARANLAITPADSNGNVQVFSNQPADIVLDLSGYVFPADFIK